MFCGETLLYAGSARRHAMLMCGDAGFGSSIVAGLVATTHGPLCRDDVLRVLYEHLPHQTRDKLGRVRLAGPVPFLCRAAFALHVVDGLPAEATGRIILLPEEAIESFAAVARAALPEEARHDPAILLDPAPVGWP